MITQAPSPNLETRTIALARGGRAVINGALVVAREACEIEVAPGAHVLTGRPLGKAHYSLHNPHVELYLSALEVANNLARFDAERFRLFELLAQVAASNVGDEVHRDCSACAAGLMAGNASEVVRFSARIAAAQIGEAKPAPAAQRLAIARVNY